MGSQLVAGSNVISDFISDPQTTAFFREKNINPLSFKQFPKGRKELGGIVESAVKAVKKLIYSSIRKTVLQFEDFELLVAETINIVNKRPVHIKEALRDSSNTEPFALTPELIVRGYELPNMNLIPDLQPVLEDPDWNNARSHEVRHKFKKLNDVRATLMRVYQEEFLQSNLG